LKTVFERRNFRSIRYFSEGINGKNVFIAKLPADIVTFSKTPEEMKIF
jgi:hypothetical protein